MSKRSKSKNLKNSTGLTRPDARFLDTSGAAKSLNASIPMIDPASLVDDGKAGDPLACVTALLEELPSQPLENVPFHVEFEPPAIEASTKLTPWGFSGKLVQLCQANMLSVMGLAERCVAARTPQEIMSVTSDFYREQGRLLNKHSDDVLRMMRL